MNKAVVSCGFLLSALTCTGVAAAEPVVQGVVLGVERVFGFSRATLGQESNGTTSTTTVTGFSLGSSRTLFSAYTFPRVGLDYVLPMGLSFGAALGVATYSLGGEAEANGVTVESQSDTSFTSLLFAPRVGYLVGFNEQFGIWPRLGFTHVSQSTEIGDSDTASSYSALTLEAPLVFTPNKFFGFLLTPAFDLGVGGSTEVNGEESDADIAANEFGLTLGLFVAF